MGKIKYSQFYANFFLVYGIYYLCWILQVKKYMSDAMEKVKRANELQAQIQARLQSQGLSGMALPGQPAPQPLTAQATAG